MANKFVISCNPRRTHWAQGRLTRAQPSLQTRVHGGTSNTSFKRINLSTHHHIRTMGSFLLSHIHHDGAVLEFRHLLL